MAKMFQNSLFGYSKKHVNDYISKMNEDFSRKIMEKDRENRNAFEVLQTEMECLKKENEQFKSERQKVAAALIDAEEFVTDLRQRAEAEDEERRNKNALFRYEEIQHIKILAEHIDRLRQELRSVINAMDKELETYSAAFRQLQIEASKQENNVNKQSDKGDEITCDTV